MERIRKASLLFFKLVHAQVILYPLQWDMLTPIQAAATQGTLGLTSDVLTATKASAYIDVIDGAISIISTRRGSFGAVK